MRGWMAKLSALFGFGTAEVQDGGFSERDILYRETRAYAHECGHAVVAWLSPAVASVEGIRFHRDGSAVTSSFFYAEHPDLLPERAVVAMGGLAGETMVWQRIRSGGFGDDLPKARKILRAFLKKSPLADLERRWNGRLADSTLDVPAMLTRRPPHDVAAAMNLCYRRAKRLLQDNRAGFYRLVALAERQGDLSREDIASQFGPRLWAPRQRR